MVQPTDFAIEIIEVFSDLLFVAIQVGWQPGLPCPTPFEVRETVIPFQVRKP